MTPASIALFRTDKIGDLILTLPAMKAVRDALPGARIAAVVAPRTRELADGQPFLDEVFAWEPGLGPAPLRAWLTDRAIDAAVFFYPRPGAAFAAWRAGVPVRIGTRYRWYAPLFTHRVPLHRRSSPRHELELNFDLLAPLGVTATGGALVPPVVTPGARREADAILQAAGIPDRFVVVHPGSGGSAQNASPGWYGRLAAAIEAAGMPVLVTGTIEEAGRILPGLEKAGLTPERFVDPSCLGALAAVLARARAVIGPSTGPLHLAAAMGVPTVGLYTLVHSQRPSRWRPLGPTGVVLQPPAGHAMDGLVIPDIVAAVGQVARP